MSARPRIADLFCGAGLVADGLIAAGWDVVGVDIEAQKHYPGPFLRHNALTLDERFLRSFDAIWASPPCLRDTAMKYAPGAKGDAHPDLITPTRAMLRKIGLPYVIENVETAPLVDPVVLCGSMFGLGFDLAPEDFGRVQRYHLRRHRKFETNWPLAAPGACRHLAPVLGVYGGHARCRSARHGGRRTADFVGLSHREIMGRAMGVPAGRELSCNEISQGVPPIYAEHVGRALLAHLARRAVAA